ncbi:HD domain-containing protein [Bremerella sp. JC817]|uniref:HD domain-containing protein n=1 Tax=Bremerella sp. JC817 TaxID=3231756 RepID=UPI00345AAAC2
MTEPSKLRRQITHQAARLLYDRQESEYYHAKMKAARRVQRGWVKEADLPSNAEIRDEVQSMARMFEGDNRLENLLAMRLEARRMMLILERFRPRIVGSVLTGHVRKGSDIDIHVFSDSISAVTAALEAENIRYDVERKHVNKPGAEGVYVHIHIREQFPFELTVRGSKEVSIVSKSSITGKPQERMSLAEFDLFLHETYEEGEYTEGMAVVENQIDRFLQYEALLLPLENVKQSPKWHPEGDALYHSLQVFDLAREKLPYDEEFLLAALLHDVGKGIDPLNHVEAGLEMLADHITQRTHWLIAHHMDAGQILEGTLGARAKRRLKESEDYEELILLARCDREGRRQGVEASELEEAIDYLRQLSYECDGW